MMANAGRDPIFWATLAIVPESGHENWLVDSCVAQISIGFVSNPEEAPDLSRLERRQERFSLPGEPLLGGPGS